MPVLIRIARTLRRTLLQSVPTILGIVILNFFLLQLAPGDAALVSGPNGGRDWVYSDYIRPAAP